MVYYIHMQSDLQEEDILMEDDPDIHVPRYGPALDFPPKRGN